MTRAVSVGDSVVPDFTFDKAIACGSDTFHFYGTTPVSVTSWLWRFGDGTTTGGQNAAHVFKTTGLQTVSLEVNNNGCRVRTEKKELVTVKPPIADLKVTYDCTDQLQVLFADATQGAETWLWDFGDGSPAATEQNPPVHPYPASGFYKVSLTTTNAECTSTDTMTVSVLSSKPEFTFDPADGFICRKSGLWLSATYPEYIDDYYWDFDDGRSAFSDTAIYNHYDTAGTYHPSLVVKYINGCFDTLYSPQPVQVTGPTASFSTLSPSTCLNDEVVFVDGSASDGLHDIIRWEWDSGDTFTETNTTPAFSHLYAQSGSYTARLVVTDNNRSCTDTAYYTVAVNPLPVVSAGVDTFACNGRGVQLQASGASSYQWLENTTLSCTDCAAPMASPSLPAVYTVVGTDANNCKNADSVAVASDLPVCDGGR